MHNYNITLHLLGKVPLTEVFFAIDCKEDDSSDSDIDMDSEQDSSSDVSSEPFSPLSSDDELDSLSSDNVTDTGVDECPMSTSVASTPDLTHPQPQKSTQLN